MAIRIVTESAADYTKAEIEKRNIKHDKKRL